MIYYLSCPQCLHVTEVESEEPIVEWSCDNCGSSPTSSLPTDAKGELLDE